MSRLTGPVNMLSVSSLTFLQLLVCQNKRWWGLIFSAAKVYFFLIYMKLVAACKCENGNKVNGKGLIY
jgi:hypothetical protein